MVFTAGNIITLGIVAVVLLAFRLRDRDNRHLEKVKKYADKCKEEISAYADEKMMAVKNFGIELDVEKKSAAQYLKNIQKLNEEELAKKSQSIAKIESHIKTFETSLNDLFGMTDRVQENLNRIRDESIFVENTGRKVAEAKEKFEQIEKALTTAQKNLVATEDRLEKQNAEILEKTAREVLASTKSIVKDFEATAQTYERKVEDHRHILIKAEKEREAVLARDLEIVKKTLREVQESAAKRADRMEEAAFVKLKEQAQERVNQIKVFFEEKIKASQDVLRTEQESINEKLKNIHGKWNDLNTALTQQQNDWKQNVQEFKMLTDKQRKDIDTTISASKQELAQSLAELKSKTHAVLKQQEDELSVILKEIGDKINYTITTQQNEITSTFKNLREKTTATVTQHQSDLAAAIKNLNEKSTLSITEQQHHLDSTLKDLREKSNSVITEQQNHIDSTLKELREKSTGYITEQQNHIDSTLKDLREKTTSAVTKQQTDLASTLKNLTEKTNNSLAEQGHEVDSALKQLREKTNAVVTNQASELASVVTNHQRELAATLKDIKDKTDSAIANQQEDLTGALKKQMEDWKNLCRDTEQDIITKTENRLEEYGNRHTEAVKQLNSLTDDAARLDKELRKLMQDAVAKINGELASYEKEAETSMEKTSAAFKTQASNFKTQLEEMDKELNKIKQLALDNTSKKLSGFEKDFAADLAKRTAELSKQIETWQDGLEQKLEKSSAKITTSWQKAEEKLNNERVKTVTSLGEKLTADLTRLKAEADAFEKGIREEMHNVDQTRAQFSEQVNKDIAEIRVTAENEVKQQVSQYQLSLQETLRQKQRELEKEIADIADRCKNAYDALEDAAAKTRESYDEWQSSYHYRMREMDDALESIRKNSRDTANENDDRIAQFRQHLEDVRKEMGAQKKLFDQANSAKLELERSIEEMNADLNRLEQKKSEILQLENQLMHTNRSVEEVNRKMQNLMSEKHRMDLMQKQFDSFVKTEALVKEKLTQVTTSDDILTNIQVQIRKLEDSLKVTEDKFQRVERKNEVLEQTNDGIDRNFKALQQTEASIKNAEKVINAIADQFDSTRTSIEALAKESVKAKDAAEKIEILDEALTKIEDRIQKMNTARDWIARTETELKKLDDDLKAQVKVAKGLATKGGAKFAVADNSKGAPAPQDRENVLRLREKGWTVDEIANAMKLGKGEVELILEIGSRG